MLGFEKAAGCIHDCNNQSCNDSLNDVRQEQLAHPQTWNFVTLAGWTHLNATY
jgi:hypothetical protein